MSHSLHGNQATFHFNGDYSGDISITIGGQTLDVPFDDLKMLVAEYVRCNEIAYLENASEDELLLGEWNSRNTA